MPTFLTAYRWEVRKLVSQKRTYLGLGAATAVPLIFVAALALQSGSPNDVAFGRYVRDSGLAIPLVLLLFASVWLFPLVTALVAGDIIAAEDHNGTLKTILTRSLDRGQIFAGKMLAAGDLRGARAPSLWESVADVAGSTRVRVQRARQPVGGPMWPPGHDARPSSPPASSVYMIPVAAVVCIGLLLSALTRNSAAAVVGTLMFALLHAARRHPPGALRHRTRIC